MSIATKLREAITASGLSYSELGRRVGVDQSQISRFMRCERGLTLETIDTLCALLGLELVTLLPSDRKVRQRPGKDMKTAPADEIQRLLAQCTEKILAILRSRLTEEENAILRGKLEGQSQAEIARTIRCTRTEVDILTRLLWRRARQVYQELFKEAP